MTAAAAIALVATIPCLDSGSAAALTLYCRDLRGLLAVARPWRFCWMDITRRLPLRATSPCGSPSQYHRRAR